MKECILREQVAEYAIRKLGTTIIDNLINFLNHSNCRLSALGTTLNLYSCTRSCSVDIVRIAFVSEKPSIIRFRTNIFVIREHPYLGRCDGTANRSFRTAAESSNAASSPAQLGIGIVK
jgi:hypothetical protein